jgi:predicted MFS family arabinose efflux permease
VPETVAALGAGTGARAWILSSMSVGLAAGLLASGAIGDAAGRRRTYVLGLAVMGTGSLGAALAPTSLVFVLARVVEGLGGAAVLACGLAVLAAAFPVPAERARATGVWGASVGVGITTGAVLAAGLHVGTGWRETYVVVAVAALALVVPSRRSLAESSADRAAQRLDLPGVVTLAAALTLLVSGLTEARTGLSAGAVALLLGALLLLGGFVLVERRVPAPMVDLGLLRTPAFLSATLGALVVGMGIIGMSSNVPLLVQVGLGRSLWTATLVVLGWSATSVVTSLLVRRFPIPLPGSTVIALALAVVGVGQLLALGVHAGSSPWRLLPAMVVAGLATGVLNAVLGREAVASVPADRAAMGSGSNNTARYLGAALGITAFSVLLGHSGSVVDAWTEAVLVSSAVTLVGAVVIGLVGVRTKSQA